MSSDDNGTDDVKCAPLHRLCAPLPREQWRRNGLHVPSMRERAMCRSGIVDCSADAACMPKRAVNRVKVKERQEATTASEHCNGYRMARV